MSTPDETTLRIAVFPDDADNVEQLLREYFAWLELPSSHRGFDEEMKQLACHYSGDAGILMLLEKEHAVIGCIALQKHDSDVAEVRRLYVRERYKGHGYGEYLMLEALKVARTLKFKKLVLGAIPKTKKAQALYLKIGFKRSDPFYESPPEGTSFYSYTL